MKTTNLIEDTKRLGLVIGAVLLGACSLQAAQTNYGDFSGTSVVFGNVTESSITDAIPMYGAPTVSGNTLDFNAIGLGATTTGGGIDLTDAQLDMTIQAMSGTSIEQLVFKERGDYTLAGIGTADTYVNVTASFFVDIIAVDGVGITPVSFDAHMVFTPNASGQFDLVDDPGVGVFWAGSLTLDINGALDLAGISYTTGATAVKLNLDNTLVAQSESGTTSLIQKKDLGISMSVVPEPSSLALACLGLTALVQIVRKRNV